MKSPRPTERAISTDFDLSRHLGRFKQKSVFEHAQNAQIQIIHRMRKVSSGP